MDALGWKPVPAFVVGSPAGTTPPAERLLTALPGTLLPKHVGAFAPKNAALSSCSRKMVARYLLSGRSPTTAFESRR
jgi:hypothetical protein